MFIIFSKPCLIFFSEKHEALNSVKCWVFSVKLKKKKMRRQNIEDLKAEYRSQKIEDRRKPKKKKSNYKI